MAADISVVILCYKEGRRVEKFVNVVIGEIEKVTKNWELILVGNYHCEDLEKNCDETPHAVRELAQKDSRIKAVALEKKGMMGWDARSGLAAATGDTIAIIDGDGQMCASDLCDVYQKLVDEKLDMVKTYRSRREDGIYRELYSKTYNLFFRFLFPGFPVRDVNSKPKIFTRAFYEKLDLTSDDWFFDAEVIIQARRLGCRYGEIPTVFRKAENRQSFVKMKHIKEFLRNMLKARYGEFFNR
jgi:glycosyltransferase involved in cell wall biosynthesis